MNQYRLIIYNDIYPKVAVQMAKQAYAAYASFVVEPLQSNSIELKISVHENFQSQADEVCNEFLNYLLDTSIQMLMEKTNGN